MKRLITVFMFFSLIFLCACREKKVEKKILPRPEALAELAALQVTFSDVEYYADTKSFSGIESSVKLGATFETEADYTVDLSEAKVTLTDENTVTVVIPEPRPAHARINHDKTKYFIKKKDRMRKFNDLIQAMNKVHKKAEDNLNQNLNDPEFVRMAKTQVRNIVTAWYASLGYTAVVEWENKK